MTPVQINVHMIFIIAAQIGSLNIFIYLFKENEDRSCLNTVRLSGKKQVSFNPAHNLLLPSQSLLFQAKA